MKVARHRVGVAVIAASLAFAACSGDDATPTTVGPTTTAPATTTTTAAPETTTTAEATTTTTATTTTVGTDTVGDPAALEASIRQIAEELVRFYPDLDPDEVPIPDLTNPDPTVAVEEANLFGIWIAANAPAADWAPITAAPDSPEFEIISDTQEELFSRDWRRINVEGWTYHEGNVVELSTVDLSDYDGTVPPTAVAVLYRSSSGPLELVRADDGSLVQQVIDGWDWFSVAILVPTDQGWRLWDTLLNVEGAA